ncbi:MULTISPECIES: tetratricopeptide repeat protein [unclassified Aminobacter]|uniref:tetratricopeptide repeat protein n=1 Tax=unclassified Aminobacter TaxID=2644704 RepID=UPI000467D5EE|nr:MULTISPECIES: tetratricopeptide repeat protein [unclassified Aminobacter]TWG63106.1 hypothetical protein L610_000200000880 [Aminobacter sp. J44]TWH34965.1 hypothetical protein L611_001400000880 [Aminobacter sp. J15]
MSDDSFFREVDSELRQDQAKALWDRFGSYIIGGAIAIVVGTAAFVAWDHWTTNKANASGDIYLQALAQAREGKTDEAKASLEKLEAEGYGAYPVLARLRTATLLSQSGDFKGAVAGFDAVAADTSVPTSIRDMARLRAAFVLVDHGTYAEVAQRVEPLTADTNALRHSAREALALSAWKEGRAADAATLFDQITEDEATPMNLRRRAEMMSELIRGSGSAS